MNQEIVNFSDSELQSKLLNLATNCRIMFSVSCILRLTNSLNRSCRDAEIDSRFYSFGSAVWEGVERGCLKKVRKFEEDLTLLLMDEDVEGDICDILINNIATSSLYLIEFSKDNSIDSVIWIAQKNYETCDYFASLSLNRDKYDSLTEQNIVTSHLVQRELLRQKRDLDLLATNSVDSVARVKSLCSSEYCF